MPGMLLLAHLRAGSPARARVPLPRRGVPGGGGLVVAWWGCVLCWGAVWGLNFVLQVCEGLRAHAMMMMSFEAGACIYHANQAKLLGIALSLLGRGGGLGGAWGRGCRFFWKMLQWRATRPVVTSS